jgi:hypothetical protein
LDKKLKERFTTLIKTLQHIYNNMFYIDK